MPTGRSFHCWATYRHQTNSGQIFWANRSNCTTISIIIIHFIWPNKAWALWRIKLFPPEFSKSVLQSITLKQAKATPQGRCGEWLLWTKNNWQYCLHCESTQGWPKVCVSRGERRCSDEVRVVQNLGGSLASRKDHCCPFHNSSWGLKGQRVNLPEEGCIYSASEQR